MKTFLLCICILAVCGCGQQVSDADIAVDKQNFINSTKGIVREDTVSCVYSNPSEAVICRGLSHTGVLVIGKFKHSKDGVAMTYISE